SRPDSTGVASWAPSGSHSARRRRRACASRSAPPTRATPCSSTPPCPTGPPPMAPTRPAACSTSPTTARPTATTGFATSPRSVGRIPPTASGSPAGSTCTASEAAAPSGGGAPPDEVGGFERHHHLAVLVQQLAVGLDEPPVGLGARRRRLEHGGAEAQGVARAHRLEPAQLVDAGRAHRCGVAEHRLVEHAHEQGAGVPAARDEPAVDRL